METKENETIDERGCIHVSQDDTEYSFGCV